MAYARSCVVCCATTVFDLRGWHVHQMTEACADRFDLKRIGTAYAKGIKQLEIMHGIL